MRYSQETQIVGLNVITSLWKAFFPEIQRSVSCNLMNDVGSSLEIQFPRWYLDISPELSPQRSLRQAINQDPGPSCHRPDL